MLTPLVAHSAYSLLWGVPTPRRLVECAASAGIGALALTDRNGLYGLPSFLGVCKELGVRPILGAELAASWGRVIVIARDKAGFSRLSRLLSKRAALLNDAKLSAAAHPFIARAAGTSRTGAESERAASSASAESARAARAGADVDAMLMRELLSLAGMADPGVFFLSDSSDFLRASPPSPWLFALLSGAHEERWRELSDTGHPAALSPEISFFEPGEREVQRLLIAIGANCAVREVPDSALAPETAIFSQKHAPAGAQLCSAPPRDAPPSSDAPIRASAARALSQGHEQSERWERDFPDAAAANRRIAEEALSEPFGGFVFPKRKGNEPAPAALRRLAEAGILRRYGAAAPPVRARLEYELGIIEKKGFCDYFLVVYDIIQKARKICGRGSAAASIVSYALAITDVDPIAHDLYFDRFLNPGRVDPPDIDVDFAWDERDDILAQAVAMFGEEHCARVANHNCFRFRGALRDTARAFGMPDEETSAIENQIEFDREGSLARADPAWKEIFELARAISGLPRNLGTHSGGIVIVPGDIVDHVPVERTGSGILVTAWDKDGVEDAGLVKIDLLGNRSLAVVRDALVNLEENGITLDQRAWRPEDDSATVEMIARGETMGVFYVESPAMRLLQKKTGLGDFAHLVIHSSIIRPAANRYIEEYIERLKGKPWQPLHPALGELFAESYGIMCYQEDVSKAATALAGFSSSDADAIRKILTKKDRSHRLAMWKQRFFDGAAERGVALEVIEAVWDMIMSFSGYSFVKAHSASYAMLSFQSAWLRAHHPAEFMAGVISNHGGFYSTLAYASEARRMGLTLLPPDVNESAIRCRGRGREIRWGLGMIAGVGEPTLKAIVAARESGASIVPPRGDPGVAHHAPAPPQPDRARSNGASNLGRTRVARPFLSIEDFAARVPFTREEAEALVGSGALDSLSGGLSRSAVLMRLLLKVNDRARRTEADLFASEDAGPAFAHAHDNQLDPREEKTRPRLSAAPSPAFVSHPGHATSSIRARRDAISQMRWLSTTLACHPLSLVPGALETPRARASSLSARVGATVRLVGWLITAKEVLTAHEEPMEFLTFEDETATFETVLFPAAYTRFRPALLEGGAFIVEGKVEESHGAITITIGNLRRLPPIPKLGDTRRVLPQGGFGSWRRGWE